MTVVPTELPEVLLIEPDVYADDRGFFAEVWESRRYADVGVPSRFVQDNLSLSKRGSIRGLHFQNPHAQTKLVTVLEGEAYVVALDVRRDSERFGRWVGIMLSGQSKSQLFIPGGFAHGFQAVSENMLYHYKCTELYHPKDEHVVLWSDASLGIPWPIPDPHLSPRDAAARPLADLDPGCFVF